MFTEAHHLFRYTNGEQATIVKRGHTLKLLKNWPIWILGKLGSHVLLKGLSLIDPLEFLKVPQGC